MHKVYSHNSEISQQNKERRSNNQFQNLNGRKRVDINILLNRIELNKKNESRKKLYFSAAASTGLILFGFLIF